MILIAKCMVALFGLFIISSGLIMLIAPEKARDILRKAGSTPLINYGEITVRLIPAIALIVSANSSSSTLFFQLLGWFMLATSLILYLVPRRLHHSYSLKSAEVLKPHYFQLISPLAFLFGFYLIYSLL